VQTVGLDVHHSWELAAALGAGGAIMAASSRQRVRTVGAFARETAVIGFLYGLWQVAGSLATTSTVGAYARARWIERFERGLPLPSERSVQHIILGHRLVIGFCDYYYAAMHVSTMLAFLIWLFWRHRGRYRPVRQVMAWTTLGCLIVQLVPVAPPRMLPGIVDTGLRYHESVYSNGLPIDQLSTMPSVHVAWAVLVGYYTWRISPSRWRYIGPAHSVLMIFVVVVTGNHWWLDGIVAVAILAVCAWAVLGVSSVWRRGRTHWALDRHPPTARPAMAEAVLRG
jgi:PAP2 superfamily